MKKTILAIETSCDETAVSIVQCGKTKSGYGFEILSNVVASQIDIHKKWGGVYPELASRAHLESMIPVISEALEPVREVKSEKLKVKSEINNKPIIHNSSFIIQHYIDAIAVTVGPGLIGSLLMGVETAQILAAYFKKPVVPVNHLEGHIYAAFCSVSEKLKVKSEKCNSKIKSFENCDIGNSLKIVNCKLKIPVAGIFPALALIVSGGHTSFVLMNSHLSYRVVGQTIDDAAGEAFDKVARILDLGYPGGPAIEKLGKKGNPDAYALPLSMLNSKDLNFSFSGLKTAVLYLVKPPKSHYDISNNLIMMSRQNKADLAASFQKTVAEILTQKTISAIKKYRPKTVILSGGVSANEYLRDYFSSRISLLSETDKLKLSFLAPPKNLSTDNALGIGIAGAIKFLNNKSTHWSKIDSMANFPIELLTGVDKKR